MRIQSLFSKSKPNNLNHYDLMQLDYIAKHHIQGRQAGTGRRLLDGLLRVGMFLILMSLLLLLFATAVGIGFAFALWTREGVWILW